MSLAQSKTITLRVDCFGSWPTAERAITSSYTNELMPGERTYQGYPTETILKKAYY